jgi:adenosylhomocysteine nucleosidase
MLIVVSGLRAESRLVRGPNVRTIAGGGDGVRLAADIDRAIAEGGARLLSFGIAGGLKPGLTPGTIVVPGIVMDSESGYATDEAFSNRLRGALSDCLQGAVVGVDAPVASVPAKQALHAVTDAIAVDMESHIAARAAARAGIPFAALRVVADPAEHSLPAAAMVGMARDGRTDVAAVLRALLRDPLQLGPLLRVALDARRAMAALSHCGQALGPVLGPPRA